MIPVRVWAPAASHITLVELDRGGGERGRMKLDRDADGVFTGDVPEGTVYGLVAEGDGAGFDPSKVLLDPYGRGVVVPKNYHPDLARREGDNAATAMKSVVVNPSDYDWEGDTPPRRPSSMAPSARSGSTMRFCGRERSESSPVSTAKSPACPDSKPVSSRSVVPELPQSRTPEGSCRPRSPAP